MKKKAKRKYYPTKLEVFYFKMTMRERKLLTARAKKYNEGNLSGWLRLAGLKYIPPKSA